jgi:hypothetical protein
MLPSLYVPGAPTRQADVLRNHGHGVSNARAWLLLKILTAEQEVLMIGPGSRPARFARPGPSVWGCPICRVPAW